MEPWRLDGGRRPYGSRSATSADAATHAFAVVGLERTGVDRCWLAAPTGRRRRSPPALTRGVPARDVVRPSSVFVFEVPVAAEHRVGVAAVVPSP